MAITKFHEKNQAVFIKKETVSGTAETSFVGTDALAALTLEGSVTNETDSYAYIGDSLSRDSFTFLKDAYADFSVETPQQVLTTLNGAIAADSVPLSIPYQVCGGFVTPISSTQGIFTAGTVFIDNSRASDVTMTAQHRKTSAEDGTNNKLAVYFGLRGMVDVSADIGQVPKLKFAFKGNASAPTASAIISPNFGTQTSSVCTAVKQATIVRAEIASLANATTATSAVTGIAKTNNVATITWTGNHSLGTNGSIIALTISGATGADGAYYNGVFMATILSATTAMYHMKGIPSGASAGTITATKGAVAKTFCFSTLQAANFFGFDYARYLTGCEEGFSKSALSTDVTVSLLEDQAGAASFDPDANLQGFFCAQVKFGSAVGSYVTYKWDKLQLTDVKNGKVGSFLGRDVTFKNTGKSFIILE